MKTYFTIISVFLITCSLQAQDFAKAKKKTQKLFNKELKNKDVNSAFLEV